MFFALVFSIKLISHTLLVVLFSLSGTSLFFCLFAYLYNKDFSVPCQGSY